MRLDMGTKGWARIDYFTCICIIGIVTEIYGYDTDVAGYLHIDAFALAPVTTVCGQSTVTLSHTGACG